jgi:hypothetical protein
MRRELLSEISPVTVIGAATLAADNTPTTIDLLGANSATILLSVGVGGITFSGVNKIDFKLTHSDDDVTYTDVVTADITGNDAVAVITGIIRSFIATHATATVYRFNYVGTKRYLKLLADFSGTHGTGTPISAVLIRGNLNISV